MHHTSATSNGAQDTFNEHAEIRKLFDCNRSSLRPAITCAIVLPYPEGNLRLTSQLTDEDVSISRKRAEVGPQYSNHLPRFPSGGHRIVMQQR
jgi:hypothetical protein